MIDTSDLSLVGVLDSAIPQGPGPRDDTGVVATGTVLEVDGSGRRVRVAVLGGSTWLPAVAGPYVVGGACRILLDTTASRPVQVLGAVDIRPPAVLGTVVSGPTSGQITITVSGSNYTVPALPGAYSTGATAWALLDEWGRPSLVIGPSTAAPPAPPGSGGGGSGGSNVIIAKTTIGPQSTGTYRSNYGRWDTWGNDIGGGVADIYQGDAYGSGPLIGLACYGDQVSNLGAIEIQTMTLTARRNSSGGGAAPLTVQGSPHGTRPAGAPASSGSVASSAGVATNSTATLDLPSDVREAFRTGAAKALVAIGGMYAGFGGTSTPGSFTLTIQYTRNA